MCLKIDTGTIQDDDELYDLVNMFKDLQRDVGDQTAEIARLKVDSANHKQETARLNRSLRQEQEERKADSANHKEETAQLNRSLLLEEDNRKKENKHLITETKQLKAIITKEREERKAVVTDLEETIEQQGAKLKECEGELRNAKKQRDNDIREISEVCTTVLFSFSPSAYPTYVHSSSPRSWSPSTFEYFWKAAVERYLTPWATVTGTNSVKTKIFLS